MGLNDLKPPRGARHARKRVGRGYGSGQGVTSGRGHKGQKSRSGYHHKRGFEGGQMPLHRRLPKRGFFNPFRVEYAVVNLDTLAERFEAGTVVTPELLRERGVVRSSTRPVKVLARGEIDRALTVHAHRFSGRAAEKIAAAGGATEVLPRHAPASETPAPAETPGAAAPAGAEAGPAPETSAGGAEDEA